MHSYDMKKLRVLVVDDNAHMVAVVEALLRAIGVGEVRGLGTGGNIVRELETWPADMMIIDHMMRPKSGLETIREIRDLEDNPLRFLPIVLMTGFGHRGIVNQARFRAGADAVLVKPLDALRLYDCIATLHDSARTFVRTRGYFGPDRRDTGMPFEQLDDVFEGPWSPLTTPAMPEALLDDSLELALVEPGGGDGESEAPGTPAGDLVEGKDRPCIEEAHS